MPAANVERYRTQEIMTATPCQLVVKLYDKAIHSLLLAEDAIRRRDVKARHAANLKALDVISHLTNTLDLERGGEIAGNLQRLYEFMCVRLVEVDVNNDPQAARDVIGLLQPLRASWQQLDEQIARRLYQNRPAMVPPSPSPIPPSASTAAQQRVVASV
ncbi:MAG: flagellar export chaperone FliS [Alphaproteobacteria bacterium]